MKSFEIKFDTENAAFDVYRQHEIASTLRRVALLVEEGQLVGSILDANGNTVGTFQATMTKDKDLETFSPGTVVITSDGIETI